MERARWTDDRLDRQMNDIDRQFDRVSDEMRAGFAEMRTGFAEIHSELHAFERHVMVLLVGFVVALLGLLGGAQL
jgi:hypothetical protein